MPRRGRLALPDDLLDLFSDGVQPDAHCREGLGRNAPALVDKPEEDVFGPDVVVVQHPRLFLSEDDDPPGPVRKPLEHAASIAPG